MGGLTDKLERSGRSKKVMGERNGAHNRNKLRKRQQGTYPRDRDKWVSAKEAEPLSLVVTELSASRLARGAGEEGALEEVGVPSNSAGVGT